MPNRSLTPTDLDATGLLTLLHSSDPLGVLSIFVDASPSARGSAIDVRNRLADLQRRVGESGPRERSRALDAAVHRIHSEIEELLDPRATGRGRALFVGLGGRSPIRFSGQLRLPNRVVLDDRPFVHPLLESLDAGRPAGVILLSQTDAEILDWRHGALLHAAHIVDEPDERIRQRPGPVATTAGRTRPTTPLREQRQRRAHDQRLRFVDRAAGHAARLADEHDWRRLLVSGDDRLAGPLIDALPAALGSIALRDRRQLSDLESSKLAAAVSERLEREQAEHELRLARRLRDAGLAGSGGALGLSDVLGALNDARVSHLVYDSGIRYQGAIGADGRLTAPPEQLPAAGRVQPEPRLTERIVERCLETGARITPVNGAAAAHLADAGGIAALLRW